MVLYQGMYNVAHFEINSNLQLYEDVYVGDKYDYDRLRKICFVSGSVYINKVIVDNSEIKGGAHVAIREDSIFINIVPEDVDNGIVIGITFYLDESGNMYAYTEKRDGTPQGAIVESFNGRTGAVVPADTDYNAGLIGYNNEASQLIAENVQDAVDELDQEIDTIQDEIDGLNAEHVAYDNTTSGLVATNVQRAIDELDNDLSGKQDRLTFDLTPTASSQNPVTSDGILHAIENVENLIPSEADEIGYDNDVSQLTANNVQGAIDELAAEKQDNLTFDSAPTSGSSNPVTSGGVYDAIPREADEISYDNTVSQLTATDTQGAIDEIVGELGTKQDALTFDTAPVADSNNPVTSGGIKTALDGKQNTLTFDNTPTLGSSNPVTSDGIAQAIGSSVAGVASFNGRNGIVVPASGDYESDMIPVDRTNTNLPASVTNVQEYIEYMNPSGVTVTLTLNGAKEDSITIFDSNNTQVGSCVFETAQISGTCQIIVPTGGGSYKFVSSVGKIKSGETLVNYEKTVTLTDTATQTVNVYPNKALYWFGNFIDSNTVTWYAGAFSIGDTEFMTLNTNDITITNSSKQGGIVSNNKLTESAVKALVTITNPEADGNVTLWGNSDLTQWEQNVLGATSNGTAVTDYVITGSAISDDYLLLLNYHTNNGTVVIKSVWAE